MVHRFIPPGQCDLDPQSLGSIKRVLSTGTEGKNKISVRSYKKKILAYLFGRKVYNPVLAIMGEFLGAAILAYFYSVIGRLWHLSRVKQTARTEFQNFKLRSRTRDGFSAAVF